MSFLDGGPPEGKSVAMAYPRNVLPSTSTKQSPALSRAWEDLRKEARKLEGELEVKIAAYGKLCSSYEGHYRGKGESGLATDQLAHAKGAEIESLLSRLSDVNDGLTSALSGGNDSRAHTLTRHRDILHDYMQEFRRMGAVLGAARDRSDLFAGSSEGSALLGAQTAGTSGQLLRERAGLQSAHAALDDVLGQATAAAGGLTEQRSLFGNINDKLLNVAERFPAVNGLLNAIRRKKSKDTIILSAVITFCILFSLIYWWNK